MADIRNNIMWSVVCESDSFIQCIAVTPDFYDALGRAYEFASDLVTGTDSGEGAITPLFDLEGDTGYGIAVTYGDKKLKTTLYILSCTHGDENDERNDEKKDKAGDPGQHAGNGAVRDQVS